MSEEEVEDQEEDQMKDRRRKRRRIEEEEGLGYFADQNALLLAKDKVYVRNIKEYLMKKLEKLQLENMENKASMHY